MHVFVNFCQNNLHNSKLLYIFAAVFTLFVLFVPPENGSALRSPTLWPDSVPPETERVISGLFLAGA